MGGEQDGLQLCVRPLPDIHQVGITEDPLGKLCMYPWIQVLDGLPETGEIQDGVFF